MQYSSQGVREETAELASLALSDAASVRSGTSPQRPYASAHPFTSATGVDSYFAGASKQDELGTRDSDGSIHPDVIEEVSEPVSPETMPSSHQSPRTSVLTQLILNSSSYGTERSSAKGTGDDDDESSPVATAKDRTTSKADERSMLLGKSTSYMSETARGYGATHDIEGQTPGGQGVDRKLARVLEWPKNKVLGFVRNAPSPKTWNLRAAWKYGFLKPASYVPPVVLGLLLNLLDALSYGP